jgi:UDP-glucuronate 4-epimerase
MIVLVTGGAGFIGSHLCARLLDEYRSVICLDNFDPYYSPSMKKKNIRHFLNRDNFYLIETDIRNKRAIESIFQKYKIDKIVHLAAKVGVRPSIQEPILYEDVNIRGTLNLLELSKKYNIEHFIFASSSSVYGNNHKIPFSEEDMVRPISPYASSKRACELFCCNYSELFDLHLSCLRFFTVYGPRQRPEMAIHKFTRLVYQEKEVPIYGDGTSCRDYTYVDDIVDGLLNALEKKFKFEIFNLGNSKTIRLQYLISLIEENLGKKARIKKLPKQPGDVKTTCADISKSRKLLDYSPKVPIEEGIKRFVEWFNTTYKTLI